MIFRMTKNAAGLVSASCADDRKAANRYCDWFVDIVDCGGTACFLLTNSFSLFSLLVPADGLDSEESFFGAAVRGIRAYFEHAGLSPLFDEFIGADCGSSVVTGTNSRGVLAAMRGMKMIISGHVLPDDAPGWRASLLAVADGLNKSLFRCRDIGGDEYIFAEEIIGSDKMREPVPEPEGANLPAGAKGRKPRSPASGQSRPACCLYAELEGYKPKIWRRILVPADFTMTKLAYTLMSVFKAGGSHLYSFEIPVIRNAVKRMQAEGRSKEEIASMKFRLRDIQIEGSPDAGGGPFGTGFPPMSSMGKDSETLAARKTKLCEVFNGGENPEFYFTYDFGDDWRFRINVVDAGLKPAARGGKTPFVTEGQGYGIIEDCGGPGGLEGLRDAFQRKSGGEYEEARDWLGCDDLDLSAFDIDAANAAIKGDMRFFESGYREMEKSSW